MNHNEHLEVDEKKIPLEFLKRISEMIENDATGFDLAYETENNQLKDRLMNDGIFFYNTFLNIGNQKFKDAPDKRKTNYQPFKLVEYTE